MVFALFAACTVSSFPPDAAPPPGHTDAAVADTPASGCGEWGLVYEVYVRSFQDSDDDGVGDLAGVTARLDHVVSLGADTLWLMPPFPAFGPAGYDVQDFDTLTPEYGDEAALDTLVAAAHDRGLRVILDLPFNHVHRSHPWFVAAEAGDPDARARFVYADTPGTDGRWYPSAAGGWYYAYFGADLPDLDLEGPAGADVAAVWARWLAHVDGFRLDAVLMLAEADGVVEGAEASHEVLAALIAGARAAHPDVCLVAEASEWQAGRTASWLDSAERAGADRVLDFVREDALVDAALTGDTRGLYEALAAEAEAGGEAGLATFLGSHDLARLPERVPSPPHRAALRAIQLLLPGTPALYYGEELDLPDATSGTGQDWAMRAPMPWDESANAGFTGGTPWFPPDAGYRAGANVAAQGNSADSPLARVRELAALRAAWRLAEADAWRPEPALDPALFAFRRESSAGRLYVVVNLGPTTVDGGAAPAGFANLAAPDAGSVGPLAPGDWQVWGAGSDPITRR